MKRLLFASLLLAVTAPNLVSAQVLTDVYGDEVIAYSSANLLTPLNAAGAPDGQYADFRASNTYLTIDMGEGEEGQGNLIATIKMINYGATGRATLYDADWAVLGTSGMTFPAYATSWTVLYDGAVPYRYVKIESPNEQQWSLDAVQATQVNTPAEAVPVTDVPAGEETVPYCTLADCGRAGELVKAPDNSAVYLIGLDGQRHTFPNTATIDSWSYSFDQIFGLIVDETTPEQLAGFPLGHNMTVRSGTFMVKIVHDPKVYAVEPGGVLRWITTEDIATAFYGDDWNKQIVDIDETFWKNYTVGAPITDQSDAPIGYHFIDHDRHYIVTKDGARPLTSAEVTALRLDDKFAGSYEVAALNATEGLADNSDLSVFAEAY